MGVPKKFLESSGPVMFGGRPVLFRGEQVFFNGNTLTDDGETLTDDGDPLLDEDGEFILDENGEIITDGGASLISKPLSSSNLLLQTVINPAGSCSDGAIIEAVTIPWFEIVKAIEEDPDLAFQLSPRKWEEMIAGAYKQAGFDEVILTPSSGDLGRDVIAIKRGLGSVRVIDQVKAYKRGNLVTANDVRSLLGILDADGASKGFLTTTSDFAPRLSSDRLIATFIPNRLELINGQMLLQKLREIAARPRTQPTR